MLITLSEIATEVDADEVDESKRVDSRSILASLAKLSKNIEDRTVLFYPRKIYYVFPGLDNKINPIKLFYCIEFTRVFVECK